MTHVDKLTKQRKPRRRQPNKAKGLSGVDKNVAELHRKTAENSKPEDKKATNAYVNAIRAQESLPPLQSGQPIIIHERSRPKKESTALITVKEVEPAVPNFSLGAENEPGSAAAFVKHQQKQAKAAKEEAKRATEKATKVEQELLKTTKAAVIQNLYKSKYNAQGVLQARAKALGVPFMIDTEITKKGGKVVKNKVAIKKEKLFEELLKKDPELQKEIDTETSKILGVEKPQKDAHEHKADDDHEKASAEVLGTGMDEGLSNFEIDKYMKGHPGYLGCIASDEIDSHIVPKVKQGVKGSFVMNLDKHDKPGSHWVSCYFTPESIEYYNSFGEPPTQSFREGAKNIANKLNPDGFFKLKVNHIQRQDDRTKTCGYHAMKFIKDRDSGKSFAESTG
jgi:hypothetical protein